MAKGTQFIEIELIEVGVRIRPASLDKAKILADDIAEKGMFQPITVRPNKKENGKYILVSGAHRLAACAELGKPAIEAKILYITALEAKLIEISENIMRTDFSPLEYADAIVKHKEIYEVVHPYTKKGHRGLIAMNTPQDEGDNLPKSKISSLVEGQENFSEQAADLYGVSRSKIQKAIWLFHHFNRNAAITLFEHPILDKKSQVYALAKLSPEDQEKVATLIADGTCKNVADAWAQVDGHTEPTVHMKMVSNITNNWGRCDASARKDILISMSKDKLPDGYRIITPEGADG